MLLFAKSAIPTKNGPNKSVEMGKSSVPPKTDYVSREME